MQEWEILLIVLFGLCSLTLTFVGFFVIEPREEKKRKAEKERLAKLTPAQREAEEKRKEAEYKNSFGYKSMHAIGKVFDVIESSWSDIPSSQSSDSSKKYTIEHDAGSHYVKDEHGNLVDVVKPNSDGSYSSSDGKTYTKKND